jgi:hypothetical protein
VLIDLLDCLLDIIVIASCNFAHVIMYLPFRVPIPKALSMMTCFVTLYVILELFEEDLVFVVERIFSRKVGALFKKTLATVRCRLLDPVQIHPFHEPRIRNVPNHRWPSAHAPEHGVVEASAFLLGDVIQQFEIAGCGAGEARVSAPDGLCLRRFGSLSLQLYLEDIMLLLSMFVGLHLNDVLVKQACAALVFSRQISQYDELVLIL